MKMVLEDKEIVFVPIDKIDIAIQKGYKEYLGNKEVNAEVILDE